jgi:hypothetical protein
MLDPLEVGKSGDHEAFKSFKPFNMFNCNSGRRMLRPYSALSPQHSALSVHGMVARGINADGNIAGGCATGSG